MLRRSILSVPLILSASGVLAAPKKTPIRNPVPKPFTGPSRTALPKPKLIALDPGHGGRDPGALGQSGTPEKNVVIAVARELRKQLLAGNSYRVILTRSIDTYVPLRERVARAQDARADLFLSLHADAHANPEVRGASVYTLSESASDREAEALAARENLGDAAVLPSSTVARTLVAMAQRGTVNDSRRLAETIVGTFGQSGIRLLPRSHRQAGFAVLTSPDIPAALVELGYLSNPRDEKLLTVRQHQIALARALRAAVDAHFAPTRKA
ncbi:MAG: N-acetylmuramoyl-L-alanine amidase [Enhydrobacter sp.]|nr:N-acetylmuramoyl-L-alanine amidase [Enhydrobacter sp.]